MINIKIFEGFVADLVDFPHLWRQAQSCHVFNVFDNSTYSENKDQLCVDIDDWAIRLWKLKQNKV